VVTTTPPAVEEAAQEDNPVLDIAPDEELAAAVDDAGAEQYSE
jgi:hypothetical protein